MNKFLVIFGSGDVAQLAHYYFSKESHYEPVAFTVDEAYITAAAFCGLPVVPFEDLPRDVVRLHDSDLLHNYCCGVRLRKLAQHN